MDEHKELDCKISKNLGRTLDPGSVSLILNGLPLHMDSHIYTELCTRSISGISQIVGWETSTFINLALRTNSLSMYLKVDTYPRASDYPQYQVVLTGGVFGPIFQSMRKLFYEENFYERPT